MLPYLADVTAFELALVACCAIVTSVIGGVAGYGTGALMPLVLVPIVGAEPVVPMIAISALFTNTARIAAFRNWLNLRRAAIAAAAGAPTCLVGAFLYTLLTGRGAAFVIGATMTASVPLRRLLLRRGYRLGEAGLAAGACGWGLVAGGTTGAGIIMLSLLMATGLEGAAVIATDAAVSMVIGTAKLTMFGFAGVLTAKTVTLALMIGLLGIPGAFLAKLLVERLPVHLHTALLDAVVIGGGALLIFGAVRM